MSPELMQAMQSVRFIAQHIKDADKDNEVSKRFFVCFFIKILFRRNSLSSFNQERKKKLIAHSHDSLFPIS